MVGVAVGLGFLGGQVKDFAGCDQSFDGNCLVNHRHGDLGVAVVLLCGAPELAADKGDGLRIVGDWFGRAHMAAGRHDDRIGGDGDQGPCRYGPALDIDGDRYGRSDHRVAHLDRGVNLAAQRADFQQQPDGALVVGQIDLLG